MISESLSKNGLLIVFFFSIISSVPFIISLLKCTLYLSRQAWQALGEMTSEAAMADFVKQVAESCTLFEPYVEAHKAEKEEAEKKRWVLILIVFYSVCPSNFA